MKKSNKYMEREDLFKMFPCLDTKRCELREIPLICAEDLFRIHSHPEGARYVDSAWDDPNQSVNRIREWHKWFHAKEDITWGIFLKEQTQLVGHIKYAYIRQYFGMIGYHLDIDYWNKGIVTEALTEVVRFLYERTDAYRLQATVHCENTASSRVLQKLGFKLEGLLRGRVFWQDRFCDLNMFALLRSDWVEFSQKY